MEYSRIKTLLQSLLIEVKNETAKEKIKELLNELESAQGSEKQDLAKIPKPLLKKIVDVISKFFHKLCEYKAITWLLDELDKLDIDI